MHHPEDWELNDHEIAKRRKLTIWTVKTIAFLTHIRTLQMTLPILIPMTSFWRILLWDQMYFQGAKPFLNLIYVAITPFCCRNYYRMLMYRSPKPRQLETILMAKYAIDGKGDPRYRERDSVMNIEFDKTRKYTRILIRILWIYNPCFGLYFLFYY